jgi:hypothetical protein
MYYSITQNIIKGSKNKNPVYWYRVSDKYLVSWANTRLR